MTGFAQTAFEVDDVIDAMEVEYNEFNRDNAEKWLKEHENKLREAAIKGGHDYIEAFCPREDFT